MLNERVIQSAAFGFGAQGVRVDAVETVIEAGRVVTGPVSVAGSVDADASVYRVDGRKNASFKAVNLLLSEGASGHRVDADAPGLRTGDFIITAHPLIEGVADHTVRISPATPGADARHVQTVLQRIDEPASKRDPGLRRQQGPRYHSKSTLLMTL